MATWKQFQDAMRETGWTDFGDIGSRWQAYKEMHAGANITLFGAVENQSSEIEWEHLFLQTSGWEEELRLLGEEPPPQLPIPDREKLLTRWPEHKSWDLPHVDIHGHRIDKPPDKWTLEEIQQYAKSPDTKTYFHGTNDINLYKIRESGFMEDTYVTRNINEAQRFAEAKRGKEGGDSVIIVLYLTPDRIKGQVPDLPLYYTTTALPAKAIQLVMWYPVPEDSRIAEEGYFKRADELAEQVKAEDNNPGNPGKQPMPKSEITNLEFYKEPKMMGDHWAIKLVDHYFDQREKILGYKGASAVNREALAFYESLLIAPTRGFWWHNTDRKHLDTILWFLRRLKVGMTREQEKDLFADFYQKLAYYRRVFTGTKDLVKALDERWGTAGRTLPVRIDTTQFEFGSVAWQDAMIHNISSKIKAGMPLDDFERAFVPTQLEHNLRLKIERGTPLTEEERIIWDWLERKGEISPKTETMETLVISLHDRKIQVTLQTALELIKELEKPTLPFPHIRRLIQDLEIDIEDLTDLGYIGSHPGGKYRLSPDDFRMLCQIKQEAQRLGDQPRERGYCENLKVLAQDRVYAAIGEISKVGHYVTAIEPHETGSTLVQKCYVQPGEPYAVGYRCPRYIAEKVDKLKTDIRIIGEDCPQHEVSMDRMVQDYADKETADQTKFDVPYYHGTRLENATTIMRDGIKRTTYETVQEYTIKDEHAADAIGNVSMARYETDAILFTAMGWIERAEKGVAGQIPESQAIFEVNPHYLDRDKMFFRDLFGRPYGELKYFDDIPPEAIMGVKVRKFYRDEKGKLKEIEKVASRHEMWKIPELREENINLRIDRMIADSKWTVYSNHHREYVPVPADVEARLERAQTPREIERILREDEAKLAAACMREEYLYCEIMAEVMSRVLKSKNTPHQMVLGKSDAGDSHMWVRIDEENYDPTDQGYGTGEFEVVYSYPEEPVKEIPAPDTLYDPDRIVESVESMVDHWNNASPFEQIGIRGIYLSGSWAKGTQSPESDVDVTLHYSGEAREDGVANFMHDPNIMDLPIDVNPISDHGLGGTGWGWYLDRVTHLYDLKNERWFRHPDRAIEPKASDIQEYIFTQPLWEYIVFYYSPETKKWKTLSVVPSPFGDYFETMEAEGFKLAQDRLPAPFDRYEVMVFRPEEGKITWKQFNRDVIIDRLCKDIRELDKSGMTSFEKMFGLTSPKTESAKERGRKALEHMGKASWSVNEVEENLTEAYALIDGLPEFSDAFSELQYANASWYPDKIDSHLGRAEEILEETLKTIEEFKDLSFEKKMEIAEKADRGEATEEELMALKAWLREPGFQEALRIHRNIDAMVVQGKGIILNLDDIRDTTKGFHKDVFRRIRESKAVRELGKVMAETDLDIMNDDDLMEFLNRMPMPPEWGAIIRPDGDFNKLSGTIGGKPLAIYWDIGNQIGVMHYHPWEVTYDKSVTFRELVPYPKLSGEDIPDILSNIKSHGIENFRYEAVFTDDKITIYDLGNYTPDKWKEIVEHAQKKIKEYPGLDMELSMLGYVEVEPILVFIFHGARDLGYIDWKTIPLKGKVNLEELFPDGRLVSAVSSDNKRVCGEPCPKHPAYGCHVACLPDELYKELKSSMLPVTDCRDPHIHGHFLPTKDGRLLAHRWGKGTDKYVAADSPRETSLKPITEEKARELIKENADWKTPDPHEPIPVYRVTLDTPKGEMNIDVPTTQGPDAAARRALWAIVAKFGFEPDEVTVMASTPVETAEEKWRPVIVLSEQGTPVTMMVPARIPTELEADIYKGIFDKIKNPEHWKLPTEPVYTEDRTNAQVIRDAIEYFHGGGEITQLDDKFKVWSKGYFFYVGGKLHVGISGKGKEKIEVCLDCIRKHLLAARALLKEVLEGIRKSGYPTLRERLKVEEIEEQIQEVEKHPLRGETSSEEVKQRLWDMHDKAYETRKKLQATKIGYPHEGIKPHGDVRDIEEVLGNVEEMLGDTYEMIAMGETSMERIEVSFKEEERRVRPAHSPPTTRPQPLTINARCATCCDHDGICHIDIDNLDGWNGEHLARIMPVLREITAPAVTELDKLNKHFGTNVDIRFWSIDDLKNAGLKTNYMGFVAHSDPSTMFLLPENIYNPLDSVRTVRHEFQHALDLSGGCPLCTSHQREKRARQFEAVTFPIAGLQRTEKVVELVVTPYSKLMKKTKDQILQVLKETHPNADYDFWIKGGTIGHRGAAATIKELVDMGIDGILITLRDATITWNTDRGYVIHAAREDIFAGKVKEQGGEAINARIDAQIAETPPVRFVKKMRIPETEETEKLYQCEKRRNDLIKQCAREWMKVTGTPKEEFWTVAVPTALHDVLDSFETSSSRIAAETFLKINARIDAQVDAQPIRVHAPTVITSLLNQTANILQIAAEKLPDEKIYFPPKESGEKQPIKLEGRVSLEDIAGLTKYLADMLAVSGRIDAQVTWEERSRAWEQEFQKAPFLFTRDRDERVKWVIGILSDVQEVIQREDFETANEWLNKAKYHLIKLGKVEGRELIMAPQRKLSAVLPDYESDAVMEMEELRRDFELGRIPDFSFDQEKARVEGKLDVILDLMALAQKGRIVGKRISAKEINVMIDAQVEEYPLKEEKKKVATNIIRHSSEGKPFGSTQMILTSGVLTTIPRDEVDHMWDDYLNDRAAIVEYHVDSKRVWIIDDGLVLTMLFPEEY